ncbi:Uncharacterized protein BP5553_04513 [Venustampulla echinocandica]|uniref:Heterokaryon incompatibility domain-containing protein n=1 Tax=Venustampulla echinocandica TaxID=2656787 RepID=A0A370TNI0_9HELO|nr:Uncharacterized protein BP5553_04513 [Venustampulla echinocandica]RDL37080.1 Uncharacterized protein BP5553_04513 [Venustampulla echinocandica]
MAHSAEPNNPCKHCAVFTSDHSEAFTASYCSLELDYERVDIFPELPELEASAKDGCVFCGLLRSSCRLYCPGDDAFNGKNPYEGRVQIHGAALSTSAPERGITTLAFNIRPIDTADSLDYVPIYFNFYSCEDTPAGSQIKQPAPLPTPLDPQNLERMKNWIEECKGSHGKCQQQQVPHLPTRVIDVGPPDGSHNPRLLITVGISGDYVALSHCWGPPSKVQYRTLLSNIGQGLQGIPMSSLPRNFQDAITVTRAFGLRYLWIDSMCIIQDSEEDWGLESKQMDTVYGAAYFVIAATSSSHSGSGFLERELKPSVQMALRCPDGSQIGHYSIRPQAKAGSGAWFQDVGMSPWNIRAWTLQERLLARRIIHFTTEKIYFECYSIDASEEGDITREVPSEQYMYMASLELKHLLGLTQQLWTIKERDGYETAAYKAYILWYTLVAMYTGRQLTFESDKFPALAGLSTRIGALLNDDDYLFGLWRKDLCNGLMWQPNMINFSQGYPRVSKGVLSQAPSWSWAAYTGGVSYCYTALVKDRQGQSLRIIDVDPRTSGFTPPPTDTPAKLKVSGLLKQGTIFRTGECRGPQVRLKLIGETGGSWDNRVKINSKEVGNCSLDCRHPSLIGEDVWLLKVMNREVENTDDYGVPAGLILEMVEEGVFQRVGLFNLDFEHESVFDDEEYRELLII